MNINEEFAYYNTILGFLPYLNNSDRENIAKRLIDNMERKITDIKPVTKFLVLTEVLGNKLEAIKALRSITDLGLKEAKDVVDTLGNVTVTLKLPHITELALKKVLDSHFLYSIEED